MLRVDEVFKRLRAARIHYRMSLPDGLGREYEVFLAEHARSDFLCLFLDNGFAVGERRHHGDGCVLRAKLSKVAGTC
jgi:hypothetical protein